MATLISETEIRRRLGNISQATFFSQHRYKADFPQPVKVSQGRHAWPEDEIDQYIGRLIATNRVQQRREAV
jgi:predicted DNA-binding transcriptional regulator AlpA